jgi:hypothetical protein
MNFSDSDFAHPEIMAYPSRITLKNSYQTTFVGQDDDSDHDYITYSSSGCESFLRNTTKRSVQP